MKKLYAFLYFFLFTVVFFAQTEDVITNIDPTARLFSNGMNVYCSYFGNIDTVDLSDESNPTIDLLVGNYSNPVGMARYQDDFYFAAFALGKIIKFNIFETELNYIDVTSSGETPNDLIIYNNYLYYSDNNGGSIYKYDLNGNSNESEIVITGYLGLTGLAIKDDFIYFSATLDGIIYKLNLNDINAIPIEVVSGLFHPLGIKIYGNDLYVSDRDASIVFKVDLFENPLQGELILSDNDITGPKDIEILGNYLYILEATKLSRIELSSLSVSEYELTTNVALYPNPTNNYIGFSNLKTEQQYSIYDLNGREILKDMVFPNQKIDVSNLNSGCYFVRLKNESHTFRFFKT
jgi:hypothetical protein